MFNYEVDKFRGVIVKLDKTLTKEEIQSFPDDLEKVIISFTLFSRFFFVILVIFYKLDIVPYDSGSHGTIYLYH